MAQGPYINSPQIIGQMASAACGQQQREPSIARELEIPARMGDLHHEITVLGEQLAALAQRLAPVCSPPFPEQANQLNGGRGEPSTHIGGQLTTATAQIRTMRDIVNDLLTRVEV